MFSGVEKVLPDGVGGTPDPTLGAVHTPDPGIKGVRGEGWG